MTDTATATPVAAQAPVPVTPANILDPATVPVPTALNVPESNTPATPSAEAAKEPPKDGENPGDQDAAQEKPDERKRSAKARIDELTAQKYQFQRERDEAVERYNKLRERLQPREIDPNDYAAQEAERLRRVINADRVEETVDRARQAEQRIAETRAEVFSAKVDVARERIPDIDNALREFAKLPLSDAAADVLAESEKAAELAWFLAQEKNREFTHRLARMSPAKQGAELARIEASIKSVQPRKTSAAPPPVPMIGASSAPSAPAPADASVTEIAAMLGYGKSK